MLEGALAPVYRCYREQSAQYSTKSESIAQELRREIWEMKICGAIHLVVIALVLTEPLLISQLKNASGA